MFQDPDSPARELTVSSGNTRGWQCARFGTVPRPFRVCGDMDLAGLTGFPHTPLRYNRFCSYPQEITLRLDGVYRLHQIQLLSHEYKVRLAPGHLMGAWFRLGGSRTTLWPPASHSDADLDEDRSVHRPTCPWHL